MSIQHVINEIQQKRLRHVENLEKRIEALDKLNSLLNKLELKAKEALSWGDLTPEFKNNIYGLSQGIGELLPKINTINEKIYPLKARFLKKTINIGVAGKAREGKSTFLQSLTGLSNKEIPTSDGFPCTGCKSIIIHKKGEPRAIVEFFSREEFLREIIHPNYEILGIEKPRSLEAFAQSLPEIGPDMQNLHKAVFEFLKKIHTSLPTIQDLLYGKEVPIEFNEITDYVTQKSSKYMAVKKAIIYTEFPEQEVENIAVVDLPGLEAAQSHEKKILSTLQQEVDAVIFLKKPSHHGSQYDREDYKVLDLIQDAIKEIDLSEWLYILLNEYEDGSNRKQVQLLKDNPPVTWSQVLVLSCNCKNPVDARRGFSLILNRLQKNLESIDNKLMEELYCHLDDIHDQLKKLLEMPLKFFQQETNDWPSKRMFDILLDQLIEDLRRNLNTLVEEFRSSDSSNNITAEFAEALEEVCKYVEQTVPIPSPEKLEAKFHDLGGWPSVIQQEMHHLRTHLTRSLSKLDDFLNKIVSDYLNKAFNDIFPPTLLAMIPSGDNPLSNSMVVIKNLLKLINEKEQPKLYEGLNYIAKFNFSYQSHFHYRVRQEMHAIDPMADPDFLKVLLPENAKKEAAPDIARGLETLYKETVYGVRKKLQSEMSMDPANAIFALIEEVRDRLSRSEDIKVEWASFLYPMRAQIWPNIFNRFAEETALRREWRLCLEEVLQAARGFCRDEQL